MKSFITKTIFGAGAALLLALAPANAAQVSLSVGLTDTRSLGDVINTLNGNTFGGQADRDVYVINKLRPLALNGTTSDTLVSGNQTTTYNYTRSGNSFATLNPATTTGSQIASGAGVVNSGGFVYVTLTSKFDYFVAAYDGQNGGTEVYYVGDLAVGDVIKITFNAEPTGSPAHLTASTRYGMTGWGLFNPSGSSVPDAGSTLALLGVALGGLGFFRRVRA